MTSIHTESTFESAIIAHLTANGWPAGNSPDFSRDLVFDKKAVLSFIKTSQPKEWAKLQSYYKDDTESKFINEVALEYYRLQKIAEGDLVLQVQGEFGIDTTTEAGISRTKDEKDKLSNIIKVLNDKYGTDFSDADKLFFAQIEEELYRDEDLKKRALNNPLDNFKYAFEEVFINKLIERMDSNQEIFDKIMENSEFKNDVKDWLIKKIYQRFNEAQK